MTISEKDIFTFVFFRDKLSDDKIKYLSESGLFRDEISFYLSLKAKLYASSDTYILKPVIINLPEYSGSLPRFAAASADLTRRTEFTTFTDDKSVYLCRLVKTESKNLLYIISADEKTDKKLNVTIFPSEETYQLNDIKDPINLPDVIVNQIHLEELSTKE
jgi:hypothetical protein